MKDLSTKQQEDTKKGFQAKKEGVEASKNACMKMKGAELKIKVFRRFSGENKSGRAKRRSL